MGGPDDPNAHHSHFEELFVRSPRQLLAVCAVTMALVGWQTIKYPPSFLAYSWLWGSLAFVGGIVCATTAVYPRRLLVIADGALLVTISAGRAVALLGESLADDFADPIFETSFLIGAIVWLLVALLFFVAWREYVVPWSIAERRRRARLQRRPR